MSQDNGNWLSAEQAVMPDGSERQNLPLINRKLPHLSPQQLPAARRRQTLKKHQRYLPGQRRQTEFSRSNTSCGGISGGIVPEG